jgi:hypothetical protein
MRMGELIRIALLLSGVTLAPAPAACCAESAVRSTASNVRGAAVASTSAAPRANEPRAARRADAWFGSDKVPHFWMSYATTAFTFAAVSAAGGDVDTALLAGVGAGAAAGVGKEIHDWRRGWTFSIRDLTVDALGVAAAYFFLREVR